VRDVPERKSRHVRRKSKRDSTKKAFMFAKSTKSSNRARVGREFGVP
jgi:hypothetical protein